MTVLAAPTPAVASDGQPTPRRLVGGAILAGLGAIIFSVAAGGYVAASIGHLPASAAADARALRDAVPWIVALGLVHIVAAMAILRGRDVVRMVAAVASGFVALAAATSAALIAGGVDPTGWSGAGHPAASGIGILTVVAALYGTVALVSGSEAATD